MKQEHTYEEYNADVFSVYCALAKLPSQGTDILLFKLKMIIISK